MNDSFALDSPDSLAIAIIIIINAIIGYFREAKAESAVAALKQLSAPKAGDFVPADCRIIQASQLSADEAILTGESLLVNKVMSPILGRGVLADRKNMLFASTAVTTGSSSELPWAAVVQRLRAKLLQ